MYDKIKLGNNCETYLVFKESKDRMGRDGVFESEIYPRKEIQIKDLYYAHRKKFIALSEQQKKQLEKEEIENISYWMERLFMDDEEEESTYSNHNTKQATGYQKKK